MERYFNASIKWISFRRGGRKKVPKEGSRYCPLIRMKEDGSYVDWSIDFICPDFAKSNYIVFKFLVDTAPSYLIKKDAEYEIYEGNKKVAKIKIMNIIEQEI